VISTEIGSGSVLAVTASPALDRVILAPGAAGGGTVRTSRVLDTPGGKAIHVAMIAAALSVKAEIILPLGGSRGRYIEQLLAAEPLEFWAIPCGGETRRTTTVVDPEAGDVLELLEPSPPLSAVEASTLIDTVARRAVTAAVVVVNGSAPPGADDLLASLVSAAKRADTFVVLDTSGVALANAVAAGVDLVAPNVVEACGLIGQDAPTEPDVDVLARIAHAVRSRGAGAVWLSAGVHGSVLATASDTIHLSAPDVVRRVNAVGCGDALLGGLAAGLASGLPLIEACRLGVAAATDKATQLHPARIDAGATHELRTRIVTCRLEPSAERSDISGAAAG
jgi:1-phosphofructokinase family hexose kinase